MDQSPARRCAATCYGLLIFSLVIVFTNSTIYYNCLQAGEDPFLDLDVIQEPADPDKDRFCGGIFHLILFAIL